MKIIQTKHKSLKIGVRNVFMEIRQSLNTLKSWELERIVLKLTLATSNLKHRNSRKPLLAFLQYLSCYVKVLSADKMDTTLPSITFNRSGHLELTSQYHRHYELTVRSPET